MRGSWTMRVVGWAVLVTAFATSCERATDGLHGPISSAGADESGSSATVVLEDCGDATAKDECTVDSEDNDCSWASGSAFRLSPASSLCISVVGGQSGACHGGYWNDGNSLPATCPDVDKAVFFHELGDGVVELAVIDVDGHNDSYGPGGLFAQCGFTPGDPPVFDPPECKCGCT